MLLHIQIVPRYKVWSGSNKGFTDLINVRGANFDIFPLWSPPPEQILSKAQVRSNKQKILRFAAAAVTGKTTTLLHFAQQSVQEGHRHILLGGFSCEVSVPARDVLVAVDPGDNGLGG